MSESFKVLIVDDSPIYRKLVEQALSDNALSVLVATNGQQALQIIEREHPSLVITDWVMPDVTGATLCRKIRAESSASYTYVILLTSNAEKEQVVAGLTAGADDYLTKPFDQSELRARVQVGRRLIDLQRQLEAKNKLLQELALTDSLTGLPNRRAAEDWAARQLSGAARHGFSFWVAIADLDHFKGVNDKYGHQAGDGVLQKFASVLRTHTRLSDICARIGGEEFIQVVTYADEANALLVIERIRKAFEEDPFIFGGKPIPVTASFGLAGFCGKRAPKFSELLRQADAALYCAKNLGRNRVEMASMRR